MKNIYLSIALLFAVLLSVNLVSAHEVGCPGRQFAKLWGDAYLEPFTKCIRVEVSPDCAPDGSLSLVIENTNCFKVFVYKSQNGSLYELNSRDTETKQYANEEWTFSDDNIPQESNAEWTGELYFKDNPTQKIIIHAKNYPIERHDELNLARNSFCLNEANGNIENIKYRDCIFSHKLADFDGKTSEPSKQSNLVYWVIGIVLVVIILALILVEKKNFNYLNL